MVPTKMLGSARRLENARRHELYADVSTTTGAVCDKRSIARRILIRQGSRLKVDPASSLVHRCCPCHITADDSQPSLARLLAQLGLRRQGLGTSPFFNSQSCIPYTQPTVPTLALTFGPLLFQMLRARLNVNCYEQAPSLLQCNWPTTPVPVSIIGCIFYTSKKDSSQALGSPPQREEPLSDHLLEESPSCDRYRTADLVFHSSWCDLK